jgi:hypothetical protein
MQADQMPTERTLHRIRSPERMHLHTFITHRSIALTKPGGGSHCFVLRLSFGGVDFSESLEERESFKVKVVLK